MKPTDEQGFRGWRVAEEGIEGGVVMGNGYVVIASGAGTLERVLTCLNTPPTGEAALRSSELYNQARSVLAVDPGLAFSISDGARLARILFQPLETFGQMEARIRLTSGADGDEEANEEDDNVSSSLLEHLRQILPNEEELEGVLGVSVSHTQATDDGWLSESVISLPKTPVKPASTTATKKW